MTVGRLTLVGTPIGNLEDISPRAVRALAEAEVVLCEDTRRARKLYSALGLPAPRLVRLDRHNETHLAARVAEELAAGTDAVLVTDAGMPGISDPGTPVVRAVAAAGHRVEVVPGPDAVTAALVVSGLPADRYRFCGFLPRKGRARAGEMAEIAAATVTSVVYEAPSRVVATVADLLAACGPDRELAAARELTKVHEEVWRGTLAAAAQWLAGSEPRGEWVLVVGAAPPRTVEVTDEEIGEAVAELMAAGADRRSAVAGVTATLGVPKRRVYEASLRRPG